MAPANSFGIHYDHYCVHHYDHCYYQHYDRRFGSHGHSQSGALVAHLEEHVAGSYGEGVLSVLGRDVSGHLNHEAHVLAGLQEAVHGALCRIEDRLGGLHENLRGDRHAILHENFRGHLHGSLREGLHAGSRLDPPSVVHFGRLFSHQHSHHIGLPKIH
ncbi:hypothetical protein BpHYR1_010973 [Brachionus plicatilis]|uniref:Uncharacterized protein n=1 Tax=Brachionus plicatilis TaxID=10195 RepID=A0A3M7T159_BRAPC|nr:hypothetical protein BpHYR1_010973 [Brachionus plicatilis]